MARQSCSRLPMRTKSRQDFICCIRNWGKRLIRFAVNAIRRNPGGKSQVENLAGLRHGERTRTSDLLQTKNCRTLLGSEPAGELAKPSRTIRSGRHRDDIRTGIFAFEAGELRW